MKPFKSYSQAGQDRFVISVLGGRMGGTFLDVGACHPTELSNTYALESHFGWRGLLVDNDPGAISLCANQRIGPSLLADSTVLDWDAAVKEAFKIHNANFGDVRLARGLALPSVIDYLSLDVDSATLATIKKLPLDRLRFRVITAEHDSYRFGPGPRDEMRKILSDHGYIVVCADVCSADGVPYEDWLVDPKEVPFERYERFISSGLRWPEIIARA